MIPDPSGAVRAAATYSRPLLGRLRSADLSSWSAVLSKRRATRFSATTRRWKARKNQPVSESILASSSDVQCQQFPISNKRYRFRTKDQDFEQKIRISNKRSGFRTKDQDSEQKMRISNKSSGFRIKVQDSVQMIRIPYKRCQFRTKDADFQEKMAIPKKTFGFEEGSPISRKSSRRAVSGPRAPQRAPLCRRDQRAPPSAVKSTGDEEDAPWRACAQRSPMPAVRRPVRRAASPPCAGGA